MVALDHLPELTSIDIDFWNLTGNRSGLDYYALFFRAVKLQDPRPWLQSLRMKAVNLTCNGDKFPRLSGLQCLKHLQLTHCVDYNSFLEMLATLSLDLESLAIEELEDTVYFDDHTKFFDARTNMFIRSMSSMQRLRLNTNVTSEAPCDGLLDWAALYPCASAIQCLKLEYHGYIPPFPSNKIAADFRRFCSMASNLQQLSIDRIVVEPESWTSDSDPSELGSFLVSVDSSSLQRSLPLTSPHRIACRQYTR
jgi:hypothetical protein